MADGHVRSEDERHQADGEPHRPVDQRHEADERELAALGYRQELRRTWSGFSNFAISFSIISILAGCFTTFGQAWNNGGPIAVSVGWPVISAFILVIGLCLAELVSAYPTSGGIYWWASALGGVRAGYWTGWLNLAGLVAILASVAYGAATYLNTFLDLVWGGYAESFLGGQALLQQFFWFGVLLLVITAINIFSGHLMAIMNNISVWWHVVGAAVIVGILVVAPESHQSVSFVFTERINNSGFGDVHGGEFWFFALPLGFLLTQYTITGYDASAHLSEETRDASSAAARGIWQSILYSAIGGWILLLAFLFAVVDPAVVSSADPEVNPFGPGSVIALLAGALSPALLKLVVFISMSGQIYCATACMTSTSRMLFAFSRDGAVPGSRRWARVDALGVPRDAVLAAGAAAALLTVPALYRSPTGAPTAFLAVVSIGVLGLYLAFAIPIWLRWRAGDAWRPGRWSLGRNYRWMGPLAVGEIAVTSVYFVLPFGPSGTPGQEEFAWTGVNYAPIVMGVLLVALFAGWRLSARHWFTGPQVHRAARPPVGESPP